MRFLTALAAMLGLQAVWTDTVRPAVGSDPPVEIRMRGFVYVAPATMPFVVSVRPDADNRMLRVEADGEAMYRSSEVVLEGDREKLERKIHEREPRQVEAQPTRREQAEGTVRASPVEEESPLAQREHQRHYDAQATDGRIEF